MDHESLDIREKVSRWLIRWRWPMFAAALVMTAALFWPSTKLEFDASIISLFPPEDPVLQKYLESIRLFGGDEVVAVAYTDPQLLTPAGLARLHEFADRFRELMSLPAASDESAGGGTGRVESPPVRRVVSLADLPWPPHPLDTDPLYRQAFQRGLSPQELKATLLGSPLYRNLFLGEDGETTAVWLTLRPKRNDRERKELIHAIRRTAATNEPFETVVAGGAVLTHDASVYVDEDSRTLGWVSTLVLLAVIGLLFRRLRWVALPLGVVHVTLVWTKGLLALFATRLSMVSTTLTALVTVIGVAAVVQVTARYREERLRHAPRDALGRTMATTGPAVFWASLTTAAGFASLLVTSIVPVRNFAVMLAAASMFVFVAIAAIVPAVVLFGRRPRDPGEVPGERHIDQVLTRTMDWSLAHPLAVGAAAMLLLVLTVAGIFRIRTETDFTRNFRRSSPVVRSYQFIERRLGGVGALELEFPVPGELTPELVDRLRTLEDELRQNPEITSVIGVVDGLDFFDTGYIGTASRLVGARLSLAAKIALVRRQRPGALATLWNEKEGVMRMMLRAREQVPSGVKTELIRWIETTGCDTLGDSADVRVTGTYTLLNHLVSGLMADQLNSFLLATFSVFLIMCLALRSVGLGVVGLVPKLGPILMVLGAMGWLGVPIDMGTPMIASVSIGLSVGFSIHYLYRFRQERAAGVPFDEALRATHRRVGGAMVFSNLALVLGFGVLTLSNFIPTVHFSILADVALVGGLAGNLLVLPLLLRLVPLDTPAKR